MSAERTRVDTGSPPPGGQPRAEGTAVDKGLKRGTVGLLSSIVIGTASTAPAYSLAATLGFVVIAVGVKAPSMMLLAFIPMYFIAVAYAELNKREPDCGTTFTLAARAFGPRTGWLGGWGIIAADVIVMANLAQIAGSYGYRLFGFDGLAESTFWYGSPSATGNTVRNDSCRPTTSASAWVNAAASSRPDSRQANGTL